jgi:hypothetical protein
MGLPTAQTSLANAYRMRSEAAEFLAEARTAGDSKLIKEWMKLLTKAEHLVLQTEKRCGVPHKSL